MVSASYCCKIAHRTVPCAIISLCLEVTRKKVDKVYAYCSNEKYCKMFNAFFSVNGEVKELDELEVPDIAQGTVLCVELTKHTTI